MNDYSILTVLLIFLSLTKVYELVEDNIENVEVKPIYSYKIISNNKPISLLLISDEEKNHYVFIKNFNSLLKSNTNTLYPCIKCD